MVNATTKPANERRAADRFPIERDLRFKLLSKKDGEETGVGKTVNISSTGVLFTTDKLLIPGRRLEVAIHWPAKLNNHCALKLIARGRIVRFEQGRAAMEIQQYEFRTCGPSGLQ
ncbi:MAG: PilZ domain-containing protein [Bryobacteraceae bacterium]|nr:PilZ domain-containing protein [Bryobacteraceae bacterium]MDW8380312.1 PilZ domain-containing protein [Bryobacterales bacterium]